MPITRYDKIIGGLEDCVLSHVTLTKHAKKRCKQRQISLESVQKKNPEATLIKNGRTVITAYYDRPKNKVIEVANENPLVLKTNLNGYLVEVPCTEELIPKIIGSRGRNIHNLSESFKVKMKVDGEKKIIRIFCQSMEKAVFMNNFMIALIGHMEESQSKCFIFGCFNGEIKEADRNNLEEKFGKKLTFFVRENYIYYCSKSTSAVEKFIKEIGFDPKEHISFNSHDKN